MPDEVKPLLSSDNTTVVTDDNSTEEVIVTSTKDKIIRVANNTLSLESGRFVPLELSWLATLSKAPEVGDYYVFDEVTRVATIEAGEKPESDESVS